MSFNVVPMGIVIKEQLPMRSIWLAYGRAVRLRRTDEVRAGEVLGTGEVDLVWS